MSHAHQTHLDLGSIQVHRIVEQVGSYFSRQEFFPGLTDEVYAANKSWLEPHYFEAGTERVMLTIQSWIVKTKHHTILVDTCCGNDKERPNRPMWHRQKLDTYFKALKGVGLAPEDIDIVMCTHLHGDHVGWNTKLENGRWVPTFPRARYLMSATELDFWSGRFKEKPAACAWIGDSVLPVVEAGMVERVTSSHMVGDHVHLVPTPGHSIDHFGVHVGVEGRDAFVTGDFVHSPIQCRYPDLGMFSDYNQKQGCATRHAMFSRFVDTPTVMCMTHFNAPSMGRLTRWDQAYRYNPL